MCNSLEALSYLGDSSYLIQHPFVVLALIVFSTGLLFLTRKVLLRLFVILS